MPFIATVTDLYVLSAFLWCAHADSSNSHRQKIRLFLKCESVCLQISPHLRALVLYYWGSPYQSLERHESFKWLVLMNITVRESGFFSAFMTPVCSLFATTWSNGSKPYEPQVHCSYPRKLRVTVNKIQHFGLIFWSAISLNILYPNLQRLQPRLNLPFLFSGLCIHGAYNCWLFFRYMETGLLEPLFLQS